MATALRLSQHKQIAHIQFAQRVPYPARRAQSTNPANRTANKY